MKKIELITSVMLLMMYLFGCGSKNNVIKEDQGLGVLSEQRRLIVENIQDPDTRNKLLTIVDDIEVEVNKFFEYYEEHNKKIASLNKDYKSTRRDFEESMAEFNGAYEKYLRMLVDKRGGMMMLTSKEEWALIMDRESTFIPE
jgi:hypothetical protein